VGFVRNFFLTALGFLLAILVRGAVVPHAPGPLEKDTQSVIDSRASCTVLFLGSSYVGSMVDPDVFNREAEKIGYGAHACRYGIEGLKGYELRFWLERLLAYDWPKLELVVIDITLGDSLGYNPQNWFKPRVLEWHTAESVPWLFDYYVKRERGPAPERARLFASHLEHVAVRYLGIGQGIPSGPQPVQEAKADKNLHGADYEQQIAKLAQAKRKRRPGSSDWPLELRSIVRTHGAEAYFLIAPVLYSRVVPDRAVDGKDRLVVMDFNDPERYPELYLESVRGNTSHLKDEGIPEYSRLLARKLYRLERRER
jgi:hypothetical protein